MSEERDDGTSLYGLWSKTSQAWISDRSGEPRWFRDRTAAEFYRVRFHGDAVISKALPAQPWKDLPTVMK